MERSNTVVFWAKENPPASNRMGDLVTNEEFKVLSTVYWKLLPPNVLLKSNLNPFINVFIPTERDLSIITD